MKARVATVLYSTVLLPSGLHCSPGLAQQQCRPVCNCVCSTVLYGIQPYTVQFSTQHCALGHHTLPLRLAGAIRYVDPIAPRIPQHD